MSQILNLEIIDGKKHLASIISKWGGSYMSTLRYIDKILKVLPDYKSEEISLVDTLILLENAGFDLRESDTNEEVVRFRYEELKGLRDYADNNVTLDIRNKTVHFCKDSMYPVAYTIQDDMCNAQVLDFNPSKKLSIEQFYELYDNADNSTEYLKYQNKIFEVQL